MYNIIYKVLILIFLLYPAFLGFYYGGRKIKLQTKIIYATLAILLALSNMILSVATYYAGLLQDSWLNFFSFFAFETILLISIIFHLFYIFKRKYNHKITSIFAVIIFLTGLIFSISLMVFSNPNQSTSEGLSFSNSLLTLIPTLTATTLFALFGSDKENFN